MTDDEKKEFIFLAINDIYKEFNHLVNHLVILREFLGDLLKVKEGSEPKYESPSTLKIKK